MHKNRLEREINIWFASAAITLPAMALLFYGFDTAVCVGNGLTASPKPPFEITGTFVGKGRGSISTTFHGGCVVETSFGVDDGDPNTALHQPVLGEWRGPFPPVGHRVTIVSPTGRAENVRIYDFDAEKE